MAADQSFLLVVSRCFQQRSSLQAKEREAWSAKRETKIRSLEDCHSSRAAAVLWVSKLRETQEQFLHKQSLEMTGLTKRIVSGREDSTPLRL